MFITIPETNKVNLVRIKITVQCKACNTEWATILTENGSLKNGWNLCRKCSLEKKFNNDTSEINHIEESIDDKENLKNDITNTKTNN